MRMALIDLAGELLAEARRLIAVKLQRIQQAFAQRLLDLVFQFIHEHTHLDHERRQGIADIGCFAAQ
jgi:predicted NBD/HSP70 family sugar kinase